MPKTRDELTQLVSIVIKPNKNWIHTESEGPLSVETSVRQHVRATVDAGEVVAYVGSELERTFDTCGAVWTRT